MGEIVVQTRPVKILEEARGLLQRYGCLGMLGVYSRMLRLYLRNPAYRKFVKEVRQEDLAPDNVVEYLGYGLYVGRKVRGQQEDHAEADAGPTG